MSDNRLVRLATLWQRRSKAGSDCQLVMLRGDELERPDGERIQTWRLFVQERDPARRPAPKQPASPGEAVLNAAGRGSELITTPIPAGGDQIDDVI